MRCGCTPLRAGKNSKMPDVEQSCIGGQSPMSGLSFPLGCCTVGGNQGSDSPRHQVRCRRFSKLEM